MDTAIKSKANKVLAANATYYTLCNLNPFSVWYMGELKKAGAALRKAARELRALLPQDEYAGLQARIKDFLGASEGSSFQRGDMIKAIKAALEAPLPQGGGCISEADRAAEEQEWVDGTHPALRGDKLGK